METYKRSRSRNKSQFNQLSYHNKRIHFFSFDKNDKGHLMLSASKRRKSYVSTGSCKNFQSESSNNDINSNAPTTDFKTESTLIKTKNVLQHNKTKLNTSLTYRDLEDDHININLINRMTKCEQLKSEILINEQKMHYSLKKSFEPTLALPLHSFLRKESDSYRYMPCLPYDKNNIFNKKNSYKRIFTTSSTKDLSIKTSRNKSKKEKMYSLIHKTHIDAFDSHKMFKKEISSCKERKSMSEKRKIDKEKYISLIEKDRVIEPTAVILKNAEKVKLHLDEKRGRMLDQVVNKLLIEEKILNKNVNENTEYQIKTNQLKLLKEFKRVSYETISLKNKLALDDFYSKGAHKEIEKLKHTVKKLRDKWDNVDYLKSQIKRGNVLRSIQPLIPKSIQAIRTKRLCEIFKESV